MINKPISRIESKNWSDVIPQIPDDYPYSRLAIEGQEAYPAPNIYEEEIIPSILDTKQNQVLTNNAQQLTLTRKQK